MDACRGILGGLGLASIFWCSLALFGWLSTLTVVGLVFLALLIWAKREDKTLYDEERYQYPERDSDDDGSGPGFV